MSNIATKLTYLNGTKQAIKQAINEDFEVIDDNTTFREYADEISSNNAKYKDLIPKETTNATNTLDILNSSGLDKTLVTQYGNTYQETTTGKNLFDKNNANIEQGGWISVVGRKGNGGDNKLFKLAIKPSTTYTIQKIAGNRFRVGTYQNDNIADNMKFNEFQQNDSGTSITITSTPIDTYLYVQYLTGDTNEQQLLDSIQVEENSSATSYEKYTGGNPAPNPDYPQTISNVTGTNTIKIVGKNLFDISKVERNVYYNYGTTGSVPTIATSDKRITLSPTNSIKVKPSTQYTLSFPSAFRYAIAEMENNYISLGDSGWKTNTTYTFTTSATTNYIGFNFSKTDNSTITDNDWNTFINSGIQLEENSTDTPYEAYQEQSYTINLGSIELCKIRDYKDRIYYSSGEWYLEKNIGKIVLDGTENWVLPQTQTNTLRFNCEQVLVNGLDRSIMKIISDKFVNGTSTSDNGDYEHIRSAVIGYPNMISICINKTRLSNQNINSFKTWLSNNNVTVYYVLATPTTTEITESNYPTLYNQLNNIKLFEGVNHITMTNESGLDVEFDITYYKDWKLD